MGTGVDEIVDDRSLIVDVDGGGVVDLFLFRARKPPVIPKPKRAPKAIAKNNSFIMGYF